jgi:hypothetical protein
MSDETTAPEKFETYAEGRLQVARPSMALTDERQREQTAATILAALLRRHAEHSDEEVTEMLVPWAVALADALRAELAKVKP